MEKEAFIATVKSILAAHGIEQVVTASKVATKLQLYLEEHAEFATTFDGGEEESSYVVKLNWIKGG